MNSSNQSKKNLISVIIPVYNTEKYLSRCLDSIINNTYKNLEIICVDDGSTDSSFEILKKYERIDDRIIVVRQENGGVSSARNQGLDISTGDFITFIDSDDYIENTFFENCVVQFQKYNDPYSIVCVGVKRVYDNKIVGLSKNNGDIILRKDYIWIRGGMWIWGILIPRRLIIDNKVLFDEKIKTLEDEAWLNKLFLYVSQILYLPSEYYYYIFDPNSCSNQKDRFLFVESWMQVRNKLSSDFKLLNQRGSTESQKKWEKQVHRRLTNCLYGESYAKKIKYVEFLDLKNKTDGKIKGENIFFEQWLERHFPFLYFNFYMFLLLIRNRIKKGQ